MSTTIPGPQHVEATLTANVMLALDISLWEMEYLLSDSPDFHEGKEPRGVVLDVRRKTMNFRYRDTNVVSSESRCETLEQRRRDGERAIERAQARGEDTSRLVEFWHRLLREYEESLVQLGG